MLYNEIEQGGDGLEIPNIEMLSNLTEAEREYAIKILQELSRTGKSGVYEKLKYADYEEIPVDIITFVEDERYLGNAWKDSEGNSKLYPFWKDKLKELFPDNLTTSVNTFIASGARGLGKSEICITIGAYLMYRCMCLKNPLEHYRLKPTEKICFAFMNITKEAAEEIGISKFQNTVKLSPWFLSHGTLSGKTNIVWTPPEYIEIILGSQSAHVIGRPIFFAFFDEISFIKNQDIDKQKKIAIDMIDTALGGMKTRFMHEGKTETLMTLASSKRSEKSFLETHIKKKKASEGDNIIVIDEPVWNVKPQTTFSKERFYVALGNKFLQSVVIPNTSEVDTYRKQGYKILEVPMTFKPDFVDDIDRALCDYAGISSSEISKYISGQAVQDIVSDEILNPFVKEIIEVGNAPDDKAQYYDFFDLSRVPNELKYKPLYIALDMSVSGDMTGIGGVWVVGKKPSVSELSQSNDLYYRACFSVSVKAPKGRQVSFEKNKNFIYWLKEQGFNIKGISTDSFQSVETGQVLTSKGYNYTMLSVDRVDQVSHICKPYQYFKTVIYEKRLKMFRSQTLIDEIIDLERNLNTGKIDHPSGGKKDACDAMCGAIYNASQNAERFAFDYGEDIDVAVEVAQASTQTNAEQVRVAFEEELLKAFNPMKKQKEQGEVDLSSMYLSQGIVVF